jgi:hypothetical protein
VCVCVCVCVYLYTGQKWALCVCVCVCVFVHRPEEGIRSPGAKVAGGCEPNSGSLEDWCMLLTTKPAF